MAKNMIRMLLVALLAAAMLLSSSGFVYADDSHSDNSSIVVDVGVSGNAKVDISASGPSELNVGVKGPSEVNIDAGNEVDLNVQASDESQVIIKGQGIDEPARQQETEYENQATDLNSGSLQPNDPVVGSGNQVTIMLAASAIAAGLVAFLLIGRFVYRKRSERKIKMKVDEIV
jgi:hypothetical protein